MTEADQLAPERAAEVALFFCGDVMTGRGIDQLFARSSDPELREPAVIDANGYVFLAEEENGPIQRPVSHEYPWGDALDELDRRAPDVRLINLETSVTVSDDFQPKGINYRMHPANVACLEVAKIDCCVLSNNHVLDFGDKGLVETLDTLHRTGLRTAGAGTNEREAERPAVIETTSGRRVLVFGLATTSSGVPFHWQARAGRPGVAMLADFSTASVERFAEHVERYRKPGDLVVASIHWGGNWGYDVAPAHRDFAHQLIDRAGVDLLHGHSSHHARGIEIHRDRLIVYGAGDFLNDYEGISGHEEYRDDLAVMYFAQLGDDLRSLRLHPLRIEKMQLHHADESDLDWLRRTLDRESRKLGTRVEWADGGDLRVRAA